MTLEEIISLTAAPTRLIQKITGNRLISGISEAEKQYDPRKHKVMDTTERPDKPTREPTGQLDSNGKEIYAPGIAKVNRTPLPLQQLIVKRAAAFIAGGGVSFSAPSDSESQIQLLRTVRKFWDDNKMTFRNRDIARRLLSETEVAEVWYSRKAENNVNLRCKVYSPSMGCELFPVFDNEDDLVAFGIQYEKAAQKKRYFDLYLNDWKLHFENGGSGWVMVESTELPYGKIPVIYYRIDRPDWDIVQLLIERLEKILSNFGDTNDYHASPTLFGEGDIQGFAKKGEQGKLVIGAPGSKLQYVTWEGAPEAIKLEIETLLKFIYTCTQTPNISFDEMKGLGDVSGEAWDRIMADGNLKASDYQEGVYGEGIQRRINFLKAAAAKIPGTGITEALAIETTINPVFAPFRVGDLKERVELAMSANGGEPVWSESEAVAYVGTSQDVEKTLEAIRKGREFKATPQNKDTETL